MKPRHSKSIKRSIAGMFAVTFLLATPDFAQDAAPPAGPPDAAPTEADSQPDAVATPTVEHAEEPQSARRASSPPLGTQHLIAPGEDWGAAIRKASPGDQVLLMPGVHRSVTVEGGGGSPEAPVVVRPLDPSSPILIRGDRYGIRLRNVHDVILENIIVRGATLRGITIDNGESNPGALLDGGGGSMVDWAPISTANILLRNMRIERIGPTGQRPAVLIQHVDGVEIANCVIEGWGGAAVEIVGSRNVNVHDTTFTPLDDHSQLHGVTMRAASSNVHVHRCAFNGVSESVFALGGGSKAVEFVAPLEDEDDASANGVFDAHDVVIERNTLRDCGPAFAIVSAADVELRHNSIIRPRGHVVKLVLPSQDQLPLQPPSDLTFGYNLIFWEPGDLTAYTNAAEEYPVEAITLGRNLWWSGEPEEDMPKYGPFPGPEINPQLIKVNPLLDANLKPNEPAARVFGHHARPLN